MFRDEPEYNYFIKTSCSCCEQEMIFDETQKEEDEDVRFAFFDARLESPLCSDECLLHFEEDNGWEYEEELQELQLQKQG